jgi:hypothetical protein
VLEFCQALEVPDLGDADQHVIAENFRELAQSRFEVRAQNPPRLGLQLLSRVREIQGRLFTAEDLHDSLTQLL